MVEKLKLFWLVFKKYYIIIVTLLAFVWSPIFYYNFDNEPVIGVNVFGYNKSFTILTSGTD